MERQLGCSLEEPLGVLPCVTFRGAIMTSVYCFRGSGHSYAIAEYFARELQVPVVNIDRRLAESHCQADLAVVIFPVYCQNIPAVVRDFFSKLDSKHVVLIATYGKISHGNVLWEAFKIIRGRVIAAAYVPMGHTYLDSSTQFDAQPLQPIFARTNILGPLP